MTSKKETLIKALHGSISYMEELGRMFDGVDIYDEKGYVDCDFMTEVLKILLVFMGTTQQIMVRFDHLLAPNAPDVMVKGDKNDEYAKWDVTEILKHCTLEDNVLKMPHVQFNRKSFETAKKWILEAGGKWEGGKVQGFTFPFNAERVFSILHEGKRCNLQQEYQYFATPDSLADWLVMIAGGIDENDTVLEPSAGTGALIWAVQRSCPSARVDAFELMPENKEILINKNVNVIGDDFTKECTNKYSKIIANPPFSNNQDIEHVRLMYEHLEDGGTLAAIMSKHWQMGQEKKCCDFRRWLEEVKGKQYEIDEGEFKESGTSIPTAAVVIKK